MNVSSAIEQTAKSPDVTAGERKVAYTPDPKALEDRVRELIRQPKIQAILHRYASGSPAVKPDSSDER